MKSGTSSSENCSFEMEKIVADHEKALLRYAARIVNNPVTAEDVVQNVFMKLFRHWQSEFAQAEKLKSWLYRVTHNESVDQVRHESRLRLLHEKHAEQDPPDTAHAGSGESADAEKHAMILMHMRRLHPREQQVLLLRLEEGLSYTEISRVTGRSEGNVGNIIHHAVQKLTKFIKADSNGNFCRCEP